MMMTSSPLLPVHRRRHAVAGGELEGVDQAQDLVEVAARRLRVGEGGLHLLVGADDEHRAHRDGVAGVRVDHVVEVGDLLVGVADQREVDLRALGLLDVVRPLVVVLGRVDREADHLDVALVPLGLQLGDVAELGRADRREVLGMGEQDAPAVAEPLVEVDAAFGGVSGEVGGLVTESDGHVREPPKVLDVAGGWRLFVVSRVCRYPDKVRQHWVTAPSVVHGRHGP